MYKLILLMNYFVVYNLNYFEIIHSDQFEQIPRLKLYAVAYVSLKEKENITDVIYFTVQFYKHQTR